MKKLWLSEKAISRIFWEALENSVYKSEARNDANLLSTETSKLVEKFPSEAGSISTEASTFLWLIIKYFSPKNIAEIGTYIGRSTLAMALGSSGALKNIFTCDGSFDCMKFDQVQIDKLSEEKIQSIDKIRYYGKTMSVEMLKDIQQRGEKIDLFFIDGRISPDDCDVIEKIASDDCIFILDDFEGVEKGVSNVLLLRARFKQLMLIHPFINRKSCRAGNTALLIPVNCLTVSRQQELPIDM